MKKHVALFVLVTTFLLNISVSADFLFPNTLTRIESEAFMNDTSIRGLLTIPNRIEEIGDDAFSQTGLFAMEIPSGTVRLGSQILNSAAYVRLHGENTALTGLHGVKYLIAPKNSLARTYAENASILFISDEMLLEYDGFYYQQSDEGLTLLSAKDADQIHGTIVIPGRIRDKRVTGISSFAFYGCSGLDRIHLPQILENHENLQDALHDCPAAEVIFDLDGPVVRSVTANMISGKIGETVTWTVEATSDVPIVSYLYTLEKDGQTIDTQQSNSSTYDTTIQSFGTYRLSVQVTDEKGQTAHGNSRKLYIAVEAMTMTVPETLLNGEDLEIQVNEVQDALSYSVYLTNETTGEYLGYRTLTEPGKVVFEGYLLDEGTWRITGYVYGNNFSYSVPTVRRVVISGTKPQGPEIPQHEPVILWSELMVRLSESEPYAVKYQNISNKGNSTGENIYSFCGDNCYIYPGGEYEDWQNGGRILVCGAVKQDGVWSDWGPVTEVTVLPAPKLETPELTAPAQAQAGKDLLVSFTSVEHGSYYNLYLTEGYDPEKNTWNEESAVFFEQYTHENVAVIPGYYLSSGVYTLSMYVWSEEALYESDWVSQKLEISGEQPTAPQLNADKTEQKVQGDTLTLSIHAEGAEEAYVFCDIFRNGRKDGGWEPWSVSLDENGNGIYRRNWNFNDAAEYVGATFRYRTTAVVDGIWSKISEPVDVLMIEGNKLPAPVIEVQETIQAGEDLPFHFTSVSNAVRYTASLRRVYGDELIYDWSEYDCIPDQELTVPGYLLSSGSYRLIVNAYSQDQGASRTEQIITVSGSRPVAPTVSGYPEEIHIKDNVSFVVDTTDSTWLCIRYRQIAENGTVYGWNTSKFQTTGESTNWTYRFEEYDIGRTYSFMFSVFQEGTWSAWRSIQMTVLDLPLLQPVSIHAKDSYGAGEDIVISYDPVEYAESYSLDLFKDGNPWSIYGEIIPQTYTIYGYQLEPGIYRARINAYSDSYASSQSDYVFTVLSGSKLPAPSVQVNRTEVLGTEDYTFTIDTENAQELVYRVSHTIDDWWDISSINVMESSTRWSTHNGYAVGTLSYSFAARINGLWTAWSDPITVTAIKAEELTPASLNLPSTLTVGQDLTVNVGAVENANNISVYLYNSRGARVSYNSLQGSEGGSVTFEGYLLSSGQYTVEAVASGNNARSDVQVSVLVSSGERPETPRVSSETDVGRVNVQYGFTIETADADKAAVRFYRDGYPNDVNYRTFVPSGDSTQWQDSHSTSGEVWKYAFTIRKNGIWSPWSSILSVEITSRDVLEKPVILCPNSMNAGSDLSFSFNGVEHADSYSVQLKAPNGSTRSWSATRKTEYCVMGYELVPGIYTISVTASGAEYESSTSVLQFVVSGVLMQAPEVSVDRNEVVGSESYTFTINTTNAEELVYRSSESMDYWWEYYSINVLDDTTRWSTYNANLNGGTRYYIFSARVNGLWTAWSDPIAVTAVKAEELAPASLNLPSTLTVGQDLTVDVGAVENASNIYVYLYNSRGARVSYKSLQGSEGGSVTFEGYLLSSGVYTVEAVASGNHAGSEAQASVQISAGERPEAPDVSPDTDVGRVNVQYGFTIETADADKVAVRYYRDGYPNDVNYRSFSTSGESTRWQDSHSTSGDIWKYAFAIRKNGIWSPWSPTSSVEITDRDMLEKPVLHVPESIEAGSDLYLSFSGVEHADSYTMRLADPNGNQQRWTVYPDTQRRIMGYDLVPGTYTVSVTASGAEYDSSVAVQSLTVTGTRTEAPIVTAEPVEVFTNETYTFSIETADSQEVAYRYTYGTSGLSSGTLNVLSDHTIWETSAYNSGTRSYSFCVLRGNRWSAWSQPIDIVVNTRPQLPLPEVATPESILMGRNLTVTVSPVEGATNYGVVLYNNRDQQITEIWRSTPGEFLFQGYRLQAGSIRINVTVYGQNGSSRTVTKNLTVTMAQQPESPTVTAPEQTTVSSQTNYYFDIQTEGAELGAVRYYRIGNPNELSMQNFSVSTTESTTTWRGYQYSGGNTYAYSFAVLKDGVWSEWSSFIEITVQ